MSKLALDKQQHVILSAMQALNGEGNLFLIMDEIPLTSWTTDSATLSVSERAREVW